MPLPDPVPASVVVLTRSGGAEVFLVRRSPVLRFLGGFWAFPGGSVDGVDRRGSADEVRVLARSAARELFEETGVLVPGLTLRADSRAVRHELLKRVPVTETWASAPEDDGWFSAWQPFAQVLTPRFSLRRFQATFFHLELPAGAEATIVDGELVEGRWVRPDEWLAAWDAGGMLLAPPSLYFLRRLVGRTLADALSQSTVETRAVAEGRALQQAEHTPGVIAAPLATETLPPATTTNAYFVGRERFFVVDPATRDLAERALWFGAVDARLAAGDELAGVLVTHHHADHTGSVEATAERYGVPVLAHAETFARVPLGDVERRELNDGDELSLGTAPGSGAPWTLRVLHTPGHAPGHLIFVESHARAAIVGDLISTLSTIVIDPEDGDLAQYLASLERVREHGVGMLFPAHGMSAPDGTAKLNEYLVHRAAREERLVAALGASPRTPTELVTEVYADTDQRLWPLAERSLRSGLIKLGAEGRAAERPGGWVASPPDPA